MRKPELPAAVCLEAFPVDPDFPQLIIASNPRLMLEIFRRHLKPVSGRFYQIQDCIPFRFRCRQSTSRCVLQYTLRVIEPRTGRQWDQWVTGLIYVQPGEAKRLWQEMQAADPRREIPEAWLSFEPVDFIPDLEMLVQVFPYDHKLPHLCAVMGDALRGLEPRLLAQCGPGQWQTEQRTIVPTRYRTELGAALKYTVQARDTLGARSETRRCYLKVYRNQRGAETFQLLQTLSERPGRNLFSVVRPLAYLSELRTLVLEEAAGISLQQILLENRETERAARGEERNLPPVQQTAPAPRSQTWGMGLDEEPPGRTISSARPSPSEEQRQSSPRCSRCELALRAVARAVAALNQDEPAGARYHSRAEQFDDVQRASTLVQWACPQVRAEVKEITATVVRGLEEVPPALIHRDLKTDHIFLAGARVIFIDLDSVAVGDPVRDPAHLWAHIAGRVGLAALAPDQALRAAAAFVEEYFAHVPRSWRERFPLHCAGALIEVAAAVFKRQEPLWPQTVPALIQQARCALDQLRT